jgi:hypothetical protein
MANPNEPLSVKWVFQEKRSANTSIRTLLYHVDDLPEDALGKDPDIIAQVLLFSGADGGN